MQMTEELLKEVFEEFEKFLSSKGVLASWHYNKDEGFVITSPLDFVSGAFFWTDSLQGHDFWSDIDCSWTDICVEAGLVDE